VADDKLLDAALELAESIAVHPLLGVRMTKQVLWASLGAASIDAAIMLENRTQVLASMTGRMRQAAAEFAG
jgi:enoyl-CoA hydratase